MARPFLWPQVRATVDPKTPLLAMFDEADNDPLLAVVDDADEEVVAPVKCRSKRKPLAANLPRIEVIHELPEHELLLQSLLTSQPS